jgi:rod shape-determining protein MreD
VVALLLATLQSTVIASLGLGAAKLDLALVVVACWGLTRDHRTALKWGLLTGFALDLLSVAPTGTYTLALSISAVLATFALTLGIEGAPMQIGAVALATLSYRALAYGILLLSGVNVPWDFALVGEGLASAALNGLLAPFVCWFLHGINKRINRELQRELAI